MKDFKDYNLILDRNAQLIDVLSRNIEVWNKVSKFQAAVDQLKSNQKKLLKLNALLCKDLTSIEKEKNDRRKELEDRTMTVVRILQNFAHDKQKIKLQERLYYVIPENVQNYLDAGLINVSKKIWKDANKYGEYEQTFIRKINSALHPTKLDSINKFQKEFGLSPDMIKNLEEDILNFITAMHPYNEEIDKMVEVALKMKKINKKTKKLVTNKIDRLVRNFENDNPAFYNEYFDLKDHFYKPIEEALNEDTASQDLILDENQMIQVEPKGKKQTKKNKIQK